MRHPFRCVGLLCLVVALGCSKEAERTATPSPASSPDEEKAVREKFAELQSAIQGRDSEKLWALLEKRSQADAERTAQEVRANYEKASPQEKSAQEKTLGLTSAELAGLTGKGFLKTNAFHKKYHELPEGKIERVVLGKDGATVHFLEPDGDKEKVIFVRQDGEWKVWLTMPKGSK